MFDPQFELLMTVLTSVVSADEADGPAPASWAELAAAARACGEIDPDVAQGIQDEDANGLRAILETWLAGQRHLLVHDRDVLKRALKAFRKRMKVTVLDAESSLGGGPMSGGRKSSILAIMPPERYPRSVWNELARQGRLIDAKQGMFELPAE